MNNFLLGELCEIKSSKRVHESDYVNSGVPFMRGLEISDGSIEDRNSNYSCYISVDLYNKIKEKYGVPKKGDILITAVGTIGNLYIVKDNDEFYFKDGNIIQITNLNNKIMPEYLYYFMKSPYFQRQLNNKMIGAVQKALTMAMLRTIEIPLPCIETQIKIINTLSQIDTKIRNNNHINSELESLAKTIYDYWFLQFEFPNEEGKAYKSSGGKMVWNDELKREIPEGWEVKDLGDLLDKKNRPHNYNNNINTIDLSVMPSNSISLNQLNESKNFETNLFEMKKGDLLFGSIRPYLRKAGIAPCDGAVAGTVHCYEVKNNDNYNLCMAILCSENLFNYAINISKGTKMPVVSSNDLLSFKIPYNKKITKKFNTLNIKDIICKNVMENQKLASLRDFLLPMLMNGQVTFKERNAK